MEFSEKILKSPKINFKLLWWRLSTPCAAAHGDSHETVQVECLYLVCEEMAYRVMFSCVTHLTGGRHFYLKSLPVLTIAFLILIFFSQVSGDSIYYTTVCFSKKQDHIVYHLDFWSSFPKKYSFKFVPWVFKILQEFSILSLWPHLHLLILPFCYC